MSQDYESTEKVKIVNITIKMGRKEIQMTMDEAKQLKEAMDEIFPTQMAPIQIGYPNEPYYIADQPYGNGWMFGAETSLGGEGVNTCCATLSIEPKGRIIE